MSDLRGAAGGRACLAGGRAVAAETGAVHRSRPSTTDARSRCSPGPRWRCEACRAFPATRPVRRDRSRSAARFPARCEAAVRLRPGTTCRKRRSIAAFGIDIGVDQSGGSRFGLGLGDRLRRQRARLGALQHPADIAAERQPPVRIGQCRGGLGRDRDFDRDSVVHCRLPAAGRGGGDQRAGTVTPAQGGP